MICFASSLDNQQQQQQQPPLHKQCIESPSTAEMYSNLHSDHSNPSSSSRYSEPGTCSSKLTHSPSNQPYASVQEYGLQPDLRSSTDSIYTHHSHFSQDFGYPYLQQHAVHDHSSSQGHWGGPALYAAREFNPIVGPSGTWDPLSSSFHPHQPSVYPPGSHSPCNLANGGDGSPTSAQSLAGIESFTCPGNPSLLPGLNLATTPHEAMVQQRRPFEWISKNAYQSSQPQPGNTKVLFV